MKIARENLVTVYSWINENQFEKQKLNTKFVYFVLKNKRIIQNEIDIIEEMRKNVITEGILEYEQKRLDINKKYCKKLENGEPVSENGRFVFESKEDSDKTNEEVMELQQEYIQTIKEYENKKNEFELFIKEEIEVELHKIEMGNIPDNTMNTEVMDIIFDSIE